MNAFGLFQYVFPKISPSINKNLLSSEFVQSALESTDKRIAQGKSVTPIFLFSCFLWPLAKERTNHLLEKKMSQYEAINQASNEVMVYARVRLAIPKVIQIGIRHIWQLQFRFHQMKGKKVFYTLEHPRFRAAYDFLLLRESEGEEIKSLIKWWTDIQELSAPKQKELIFPTKVKKAKLSMKFHICYLGLGSNIGSSEQNVLDAIDCLNESELITVQQTASLYLTKPWGKEDQESFVNTVVKIKTQLKPVDLLLAIQNIEKRLGRTETEKWGPRIIDIDILLYGNNVVKQQQLTIPHPHITDRDFVIVPLLELNEELVIPKKGKLHKFQPENVEESGIIKKI
jgi:2-amino-4-hydroxy-6-hydroxymethyldihydropteridine diphosphokinase